MFTVNCAVMCIVMLCFTVCIMFCRCLITVRHQLCCSCIDFCLGFDRFFKISRLPRGLEGCTVGDEEH